jgi:L-fuconolactonase
VFAVVNHEQGVEPFRKTDCLSDTERTTLMGGACAKACGWEPIVDRLSPLGG